ncbi:MAG TPA: DUF4230 domain-containing protein [Candidatus Pullichristensenella stercorigallinarum]|uniref:DUF4230 domain-containing protein n=1 Tax=Candidatus Pullichristensenella stercorigallinarum TaxID=2840909 RepID=A0A9D1CXE1_9FIRM|nr:DUF4230 domain-containing protein [Candidatus Pullichristensenella stercorigallinarum]
MTSEQREAPRRRRRRRRGGHLLRRLMTFVVFAALVAVIVWMAPSVLSEKTQVSSETVEMELKNIGELATHAGYYTNVQVIKSSRQIFGVDIPLTQSQFIFSYDGVVKAGVDFADIEIGVDEGRGQIVVTLPEVKVLSNEIDLDSLEIYDESNNIFHPLNIDDINVSLIEMQEESEAKAIENGLLESARENAEALLRGMLAGFYDAQRYAIEFV